MRLFFAILPDERAKTKLAYISQKMRNMAISGNFTRPDNLHLTLEFLGEIDNDSALRLKKLVHTFSYHRFVVQTRNMGFFSNRGSRDILVWNIEKSEDLDGLVGLLKERLHGQGFMTDDREYRPHFTIAREVKFASDVREQITSGTEPTMFMRCDRLSLMESLRINGSLVYREIAGCDLMNVADSEERE